MQKFRLCGEFVGAKLREKSRKKCRDIRCEIEPFLTRRPRLGLGIGGFLNAFLKSGKKVRAKIPMLWCSFGEFFFKQWFKIIPVW